MKTVGMHVSLACCLGALGVAGDSTCIAPHLPGPASCSECTGSGDRISGQQCVTQGRWFSCYETIEACCSDGEVHNNVDHDSCVANYNNNKGGTHINGDPDVPDDVYCDRVIAKVGLATADCQAQCKTILGSGTAPLKDKSFRQKCQYDHYQIQDNRIHFVTDTGNGKEVSPSGSSETDGDQTETCYDHWIYGYSEPNNLSGYKVFQNVTSPAQCQIKCQEDSECVRFTYTGSTLGPSESNDFNYQCVLKNKNQVIIPLTIAYTSINNPDNWDKDYCNYGMANECWTDHYRCLPCQGVKRCVWASDHHVNGFRTCDHATYCSITPDSTPSPTSDPTNQPTRGPQPGPQPTENPESTTGDDCSSSDCVRPCHCSGSGCPCDNYGKVFLRVADRPKFLQLQLRN